MRRVSGRAQYPVVLGIFLIVVGLFWVLSKNDVLHFHMKSWWPLILVGLGLMQLSGRKKVGDFWGWMLLGFGAYFFLAENGLIPRGYFSRYWPILLVLMGLWIIFGRKGPGCCERDEGKGRLSTSTGKEINEVALFNEVERNVVTEEFQGGTLTAIFEEIRIDLTGSQLADKGAVLEITSIFDNVELRIPDSWEVSIKSHEVFGKVKNRSSNSAPHSTQFLEVKASSIFSDIKIVN